jgi:hypothetical protein
VEQLMQVVRQRSTPYVPYDAIRRLEAIEKAEMERQGLEDFKMKSNEEMLAVLELA